MLRVTFVSIFSKLKRFFTIDSIHMIFACCTVIYGFVNSFSAYSEVLTLFAIPVGFLELPRKKIFLFTCF